MGVGAVFISTLALSELKVPHDPPRDQEELLAATLQIIVSFVVLCSIIIRESDIFSPCDSQEHLRRSLCNMIDGMSIPFFSAGRQIHSRTVSLTKTWTGQGRWESGLSDWATWVRGPGSRATSQIVVRRDEEAGDRSQVQTRIGEETEIEEVGTLDKVWKDSG